MNDQEILENLGPYVLIVIGVSLWGIHASVLGALLFDIGFTVVYLRLMRKVPVWAQFLMILFIISIPGGYLHWTGIPLFDWMASPFEFLQFKG